MEAQKEGAPANLEGGTDAPGTAAPSITTETAPGKMLLGTTMRRASNLLLDLYPTLHTEERKIIDLLAGELRAAALLLDLEIAKNETRRGRRAGAVRNLLERIGAVQS